MDMQDKIETMKAEHSQQIETIHRHYCEYERELQHQLTKISMDMQDKIETMKAEHSQQIHFHYHKLEIESQLQLNKITTDMKNKLAEIKTLHHHDIHRYYMYHQQNSHDHVDHLSAMTTTPNDHDGGINHNHSYTSDNSDPAPVHSEAHGSLESASAHPSKPNATHVSNVLSGPQVSAKSKVGDNIPDIRENLTATNISHQLITILVIDDKGMITVDLMGSGLNSSNNVHSEVHTSLDSGSPHPSLESKPSMSDKPDPSSSTPPEKA